MSVATPYLLAGVALFCIGLHGLLVRPQLLRKILAVNLMGSGVFLLLIALAWRPAPPGSAAPVLPDPVPHALVLTGIVVAVSATAFALALLRRLQAAVDEVNGEEHGGSSEPPPDGRPTSAPGGTR